MASYAYHMQTYQKFQESSQKAWVRSAVRGGVGCWRCVLSSAVGEKEVPYVSAQSSWLFLPPHEGTNELSAVAGGYRKGPDAS